MVRYEKKKSKGDKREFLRETEQKAFRFNFRFNLGLTFRFNH